MITREIELVWGPHICPQQRELLEPLASTAIDLAYDGLEYFGIESQTSRQATIEVIEDDSSRGGYAVNNKEFGLCVPHCDVVEDRAPSIFNTFAIGSIHELAHCVRLERVAPTTLLEYAASEGIAMCLEWEFARRVFRISERKIEYRKPLPDIRLKGAGVVFQQFREESASIDDIIIADEITPEQEEIAESLHDKWFNLPPRSKESYPKAYVLGMMAVGQLLSNGRVLSDIIEMPTQEIMGAIEQYEKAA